MAGSDGNFEDCPGNGIYPSIHYKLDRVASVPGLSYMILDNRYYKDLASNISTTVPAVVANYLGQTDPCGAVLSAAARNAVMGYFVWDEPGSTTELTRAVNWVSAFSSQDPNHITWANLLPFCNYGYFPPLGWSDYCNYVTYYLDNSGSSVASFDYYPFQSGGVWTSYNEPDGMTRYFQNLDLFSTETAKRGMTFWAFPYSTDITGMAPLTQPNLQFEAFAPIVYGAKGLIYYTYTQDQTDGYTDALVDPNNNKFPIYYWAQNINAQVEIMGPTLMSLTRVGTYHESSIDTGYAGCSNETGLATVPATERLITSIASSQQSFMVGSFFGSDNKSYLLVFNKDRNLAHSLTITLTCPQPVYQMDTLTGAWNQIYTSTSSISSTLKTAHMQLLQLGPRSTLPSTRGHLFVVGKNTSNKCIVVDGR
ncbi:MAG TPA: hypothetical protein VLX68_04635 [Chitinivibrionales bacterium]|nr:hypothetical protein [Chitinivibrionales bacterium]